MSKFIMTFFLLSLFTQLIFGSNAIHHKISAQVDPEKSFIEATDEISIPADQFKTEMFFLLTNDLSVSSETPGIEIILDKSEIKAGDFGMDKESFDVSSSITQNKYKPARSHETPISLAHL